MLDAGGNDVIQIGRSGTSPGRLRSPGGLALDAAGNLWVADEGNNRVQEFAPDGTPITAFGERGTGPGQFVRPAGLSVDCHGLVTRRRHRQQPRAAVPGGARGHLRGAAARPEPARPAAAHAAAPAAARAARHPGAQARDPRGPRAAAAGALRCALPRLDHRHAERPRGPPGGARVATLAFRAQVLPAASALILRPALSARAARRLRRALHGRRGLLAVVRVTAGASASAPTVLTRRYTVTA